MTILAGADAGGTATTARVWRDGTAVGEARGGAGAVRPTRAMAAAARIADTVRSALASATLLRADVLVVGAAGVGRNEEREELRRALRTHDLAERLVLVTDVALAHAAAFGNAAGILLVAGTGSIAVRRDAEGAMTRAGGHGWQAGDEGSGYWIGQRALWAVSRASDGRGPSTALTERVVRGLNLPAPAALVRWSLTATPSEVAALAPLVQEAAEAGDAVATAILDQAAEELVLLVRVLAEAAAGAGAVPVALSGGLVREGRPLRERIAMRLAAEAACTLQPGEVDPLAGALVLAEGAA